MTFSIVARDGETGDLGVAVHSKFLAAAALAIHARADAGAVATQALVDVSYGSRGLELMSSGWNSSRALEELLSADPLRDRRQVAFVDRAGNIAVHTGKDCMPWAGAIEADSFSCQGNVLTSSVTVEAMAAAYDDSVPLPERLVACLSAAQAAGGDARGQQAAGLLVVREAGGYGGTTDRMVDLRVDDHPAPIDELGRLLVLHRRHFQRPDKDQLLQLSGPLKKEVSERLSRVVDHGLVGADTATLWDALDRWAGRQNLEERMIRRDYVDPVVLEALREES